MQTTLQTLSTRVAGAFRLAVRSYLPASPLTGLGPASELAAQHPAFVTVPDDPRGICRLTIPAGHGRDRGCMRR
jgi:hypothetical protein